MFEDKRTTSKQDSNLTLPKNFILPAYDNECFAHIPGFIEQALTGTTSRQNFPGSLLGNIQAKTENVIFVFFDAFGWEAFERFTAGSEFLRAITNDGLVVRGTSQFPSTTSVHVTTMNTGLPLAEHGVLEWFYFEPDVDQVICPFKLSNYKDENRDTLIEQGYSSEQMLPTASFTRDLANKEISTKHYLPEFLAQSTYNHHFLDRNAIVPYKNLDQGITGVVDNLTPSSFHWIYIPDFDSACHDFGPYSHQSEQTANSLLKSLSRLLDIDNDGKTLVVLTADHGQVDIPTNTEVFINQEIPEIKSLLRRNRLGEIIRFGGGPRDMFLYAEENSTTDLANLVKTKLGSSFEVYTKTEAVSLGLFGSSSSFSERLKERLPDVIILPHKGYSVSWFETGVFERNFLKGHHGGLTPQEMEIPLCFLRL